MNEVIMREWINKCCMKRENFFFDQDKSFLIFDLTKSHLTDYAKASVKERSQMAVIPGRLTKLLQPLDKSFKNHLQSRSENWMLDPNRHTYTADGCMRHASYYEVCVWVIESFNYVTSQCIWNGFIRSLETNLFKNKF